MWMVGIRPRDSFNFKDYGYSVSDSVTNYDPQTYAVKLSDLLLVLLYLFLRAKFYLIDLTAGGVDKLSGFNNYTVVAVGFNGAPQRSGVYAYFFNTLFLSHSPQNSWSVVDANTIDGTCFRSSSPWRVFDNRDASHSARCPDFLGRESFDLYQKVSEECAIRTRVSSILLPVSMTLVPSKHPAWWLRRIIQVTLVLLVLFILNEIYNIPSYHARSLTLIQIYFIINLNGVSTFTPQCGI
jgi:hypothetical protein